MLARKQPKQQRQLKQLAIQLHQFSRKYLPIIEMLPSPAQGIIRHFEIGGSRWGERAHFLFSTNMSPLTGLKCAY
jgi:hypothetical protein